MDIGVVGSMRELGITESYKLKRQVILSASEAAEMILRVDDSEYRHYIAAGMRLTNGDSSPERTEEERRWSLDTSNRKCRFRESEIAICPSIIRFSNSKKYAIFATFMRRADSKFQSLILLSSIYFALDIRAQSFSFASATR